MSRIFPIAFVSVTLLGFLGICGSPAMAQHVEPSFQQEKINVTTGEHDGDGEGNRVAFETIIGKGDAPWSQVEFGESNLGESSFVRLTSGENGDFQELDSKDLSHWNNSSGIFRGGNVRFELVVAPQDKGVNVSIASRKVGQPPSEDQARTLCDGDDDRTPSTDPRVGRMFFGGCTAWLISNGSVLTAGHCGNARGVVEFNVPQSTSNGLTIPAAIKDQYPIDGVYQRRDEPVVESDFGQDWQVFSIGRNCDGLLAHQVQGFIRCTNALPAVGSTIRVTGFGVDDTPLSRNFVQQTDVGAYEGELSARDRIWLRHRADTRGANSGSPILWESLNVAIGIHTNAGCTTSAASANRGTSFELDGLEDAINSFGGTSPEQVDGSHPDLGGENGTVLRPWGNVASVVSAVQAGQNLNIVAGTYNETLTISKAMTIRAPVGTVTIGKTP